MTLPTRRSPNDLEIARLAKLGPLTKIAGDMGIGEHLLEPYGSDVAKIKLEAIEELSDKPMAKYVVVSAITPTPLGEGKTTTTGGLGQALSHLGKRATVAVRQPAMGPTFGIKGGAAGGGFSQVVPMEMLNLHLTGDTHAVTAAHNLLSAMLDNHVHQNDDFFHVDRHSITWRRVLDVNDRALRNIVVGLGSRADGIPRETGFDITAASEVMAILALSTSLRDLRERLGRIVIGSPVAGEPITAEDLKAAGAMAVMMREAIKPNLMQTLENTPVLVHAGPFGNIATGNSSIVADRIGIRGGDFLITEAGFGADMGAERFFNIKCRYSGLKADAAVLVATVRALKAHSGRFKIVAGRPLPPELLQENPDDVLAGADNLRKQIETIGRPGVSPVVAINAFPTDHDSEHSAIREIAEQMGARVAVADHFSGGGAGATELAEAGAGEGGGGGGRPRPLPGGGGGREGACRGGRRGRRRAHRVRLPLPRGGEPQGEDRDHSHEGLRGGRRGLRHEGRRPARLLREERLRASAGVHGQDAPLHLPAPDAAGGAQGLDASGAGGARVGGRRLHLPFVRGDEDDAGPERHTGRHAHRHRRERRDSGVVLNYLEQPLNGFLEMV